MIQKLYGALSLCRKAGKLVMGTDTVLEAIKRRKAVLVLLASDLSERSRRNLCAACEAAGMQAVGLPCTKAELSAYTGKEYGILAVCDKGFAGMIQAQLPPPEGTAGAAAQPI